jgi:hypothetical protein
MTVDDAADIICHAVRLEQFKATSESQKALERLLLSARVKLALIDVKPDAEVFATNETIVIKATTSQFEDEQLVHKLEAIAKSVPGVINIRVDLVAYTHG